MAIVWIMEDPNSGVTNLTRSLIGSFAVRCVASLKSLQILAKVEKFHSPAAVIINGDHFAQSSQELIEHVLEFINCPLILNVRIGKSNVHPICKGAFEIQDSVEYLKVLSFVRDFCDMTLNASKPKLVAFKDVQLNMEEFSYRVQPQELFEALSTLEFRLLRLFLNHPNKCFNRDELIEQVWDRVKVASRTVDSQISRLRRRLENSECKIESVYGGGYRLS